MEHDAALSDHGHAHMAGGRSSPGGLHGVESSERIENDTAVDVSYCIALARDFLGVPRTETEASSAGFTAATGPPPTQADADAIGDVVDATEGYEDPQVNDNISQRLATRESAGCVLWDLSGSETTARLLVYRCSLLEIIEAVLEAEILLAEAMDTRVVEICLGILANLYAWQGLPALILSGGPPGKVLEGGGACGSAEGDCERAPTLPRLVLWSILPSGISDIGCLSELFRLVCFALTTEVRWPLI